MPCTPTRRTPRVADEPQFISDPDRAVRLLHALAGDLEGMMLDTDGQIDRVGAIAAHVSMVAQILADVIQGKMADG